jgi:hypothetical protein
MNIFLRYSFCSSEKHTGVWDSHGFYILIACYGEANYVKNNVVRFAFSFVVLVHANGHKRISFQSCSFMYWMWCMFSCLCNGTRIMTFCVSSLSTFEYRA